MKNRSHTTLYLLSFLLLFTSRGVAQTADKAPIPIALPGQEWEIMHDMDNPQTHEEFPPEFSTKRIGEAVEMDGKRYYPVIGSGYMYKDRENKVLYYIREEDNKVFIRESQEDWDKIIFDYSLEEGDFFFMADLLWERGGLIRVPMQLIKKDVVDTAGAERRRYFFAKLHPSGSSDQPFDNSSRLYTWVEGLGSPNDCISQCCATRVGAGYDPLAICFTDKEGVKHGIWGHMCKEDWTKGKHNVQEGAYTSQEVLLPPTVASSPKEEKSTSLPLVVPNRRWQVMLLPNTKENPTNEPVFYSWRIEEPVVHNKKIFYLLESNAAAIHQSGATWQACFAPIRDDGDKVVLHGVYIPLMDYSLEVGKYFPLTKGIGATKDFTGGERTIFAVLRKIERVETAGASRRCYYFEELDRKKPDTEDDTRLYYRWIEGIGTPDNGVFFIPKNDAGEPAISQTVCFTDEDGVSHPIFNGTCANPDKTSEVVKASNTFIATLKGGELTIVATDSNAHQLRLYTLSGDTLLEGVSFVGSYTAKNLSQNTLVVSVDGVSKKVVARK